MSRLGKRALKQEILRLLWRGALLAALLGVTWIMGKAAWDMYGRFELAAQAASGAEAQRARLEGQYAQVGASVERFQSPRGIEAALRERYGVAREGEGQIDIVRPAQVEAAAATAPGDNFFSRIFNALFVW